MSSSYYNQKGNRTRHRLGRALQILFFLGFLVGFVLAAYLVYDVWRQSKASDTESAATTPITTTIQSDSVLQRTPYFEFYASRKWRPVTDLTKDGRYVFREINNQTGGQEFTVEVNESDPEVLALVQTTRVLPVLIGDSGELVPKNLSDHCNKAVPNATERVPRMVTYQKVTFACSMDGRLYNAVVGLEGGTSTISLKRPDGTTAAYRMSYRNFTATPNSGDFISIVKSFKTR